MQIITLDEFINYQQNEFGALKGLLRDIGVAAKIVNREVNKAGLVNILGMDGSENASGDVVQRLDIYANTKLIECLKNSGECAAIASEELENFLELPRVENKAPDYLVVFDPLDGSSNIDVNVSVGTIFGIYKRISPNDGAVKLDDFLQAGIELVGAGYVIYGTSTILVYTTGKGVHGFTLDPSIGEFCLSHRDIKIPRTGNFYSVNQGYYLKFDVEMRRYIDHCSDMNYSLRYIGSMVSDVHRILFQGGIFLYPNTRKFPKGKLRLLYECAPLSFVVEQAGGRSISLGRNRIMNIAPKSLHQNITIALGSPDMVTEMEEFLEKYAAKPI